MIFERFLVKIGWFFRKNKKQSINAFQETPHQ
jgi:hypothetical protein